MEGNHQEAHAGDESETRQVLNHEREPEQAPRIAGSRTDLRRFVRNFILLECLDVINPDKVPHSAAFKLGALAGMLPALSIISIYQFIQPFDVGTLYLDGANGEKTLGWGYMSLKLFSALIVTACSALVGGAVAFFWAENRLRTIFSYGIAGPTIVLSIFVSGLSGIKQQAVVEKGEERATQLQEEVKTLETRLLGLNEQWTEQTKLLRNANSVQPDLGSSLPAELPAAPQSIPAEQESDPDIAQ